MEEREEVRFGKKLTEHLKALLASAHPRQPVMDEGDFHGRSEKF